MSRFPRGLEFRPPLYPNLCIVCMYNRRREVKIQGENGRQTGRGGAGDPSDDSDRSSFTATALSSKSTSLTLPTLFIPPSYAPIMASEDDDYVGGSGSDVGPNLPPSDDRRRAPPPSSSLLLPPRPRPNITMMPPSSPLPLRIISRQRTTMGTGSRRCHPPPRPGCDGRRH